MKKKLLFVHPTMQFGGAEKSLQTLLCMIDYDRYDVDLCLLRPEGELLKLLPDQVHVLPMQETARIFYMPLSSSCLRLLQRGKLSMCAQRILFSAAVRGDLPIRMREQRGWKHQKRAYAPLPQEYDAAVAYMEGSPIYFCADLVRAKRKIALIHSDYRRLEMSRDFDSAYFAQFDVLAGVSDACADVLRACFPEHRDKICVLENLISPSVLRERSSEPADFDAGYTGIRVLTMGRLDEPKGIDIAVDVCDALKDCCDFRWYVLGDGPQREMLTDKIAGAGLQDRFFLLGAKLNPYPYLAQCDVYVQPSRFEGKSIAIEEAKCFAKPIVTTAFTTVRNQIEDGVTGSIAQIDPADIAEKLRALLTDPALRQKYTDALRGFAGNTQELEKWEKIWQEYESVC